MEPFDVVSSMGEGAKASSYPQISMTNNSTIPANSIYMESARLRAAWLKRALQQMLRRRFNFQVHFNRNCATFLKIRLQFRGGGCSRNQTENMLQNIFFTKHRQEISFYFLENLDYSALRMQ